MAQLDQAFDSNQHKDMGNFEPIPTGKYTAQIISSDIKDTRAGNGKYIKFEFEVMGGEFNGRKIWANLNIVNPNPQAVEIAQKELSSICRATGKPVIQDTQELHMVPFILGVGIKPAKGDYPAANKPTSYSQLKGSVVSAPPVSSGQSAPADVDPSSVPWA